MTRRARQLVTTLLCLLAAQFLLGMTASFYARIPREHPEVTEGQWDGDKVVLMAFPDRETFTARVTSPEYREISKDRLAAAETTGTLIRGLM